MVNRAVILKLIDFINLHYFNKRLPSLALTSSLTLILFLIPTLTLTWNIHAKKTWKTTAG